MSKPQHSASSSSSKSEKNNDPKSQGPSITLPLTSPAIYASSAPSDGLPPLQPTPSVLSSFYETTIRQPLAPSVSTRFASGPFVAKTYVGLMEEVLKLYLSLTVSFVAAPSPSSPSTVDNICVLLPNSPTFSIISLATSALHSALVPLYTTSTQDHREYIVQQTCPALMYVDYRLLHLLPQGSCDATTLIITGGPVPPSFLAPNFLRVTSLAEIMAEGSVLLESRLR